MSKAVTNEEVEDVLSSIRRLVSEDKRPLAGLRNAAPAVPDEAPDAEEISHFVLTPALRVADEPSGPEDTEDDMAPDSIDGHESDAHSTEDDGPLDLGSVARETWTHTEEDGADVALTEPLILVSEDSTSADDLVDTLVQDAVAQDVAEDDEDPDALVDGDYGDEGYWDVEEDPRHDEITHALEPEEEVDSVHAEWILDREDTLSDDNSFADDAETAMDDAFEDDMNAHETFEPENDAPVSEEPEMSDFSAAETIPLTAKIAALEAAVSEIAHEWEPDGDEMETLAASATPAAMAWEDDVELDAKGAPVRDEPMHDIPDAEGIEQDSVDEAPAPEQHSDPSKAETVPLAAAFGGEDQVLDEETLREMVGEIVRAELQGALGERITRNVRKLVRREIHRALTAQEME